MCTKASLTNVKHLLFTDVVPETNTGPTLYYVAVPNKVIAEFYFAILQLNCEFFSELSAQIFELFVLGTHANEIFMDVSGIVVKRHEIFLLRSTF